MTGSTHRSILPPLSSEESAHSEAVAALIRGRIADAAPQGRISFEEFMRLALYAPGLGYYSAGSVKIGAAGDFVTAPEVSDLFSQCVADQCAEVLSETGGEILELGAGTGRMAAVILEALNARGCLPERYSILEVSADLADRQRTRISKLPVALRERVVWLDRLPSTPIKGVILANEVLDALQFRRVVVREGGIAELGVAYAAAQFTEREVEPSDELQAAWESTVRDLPEALPEGYRTEICLAVEPWIASLSQCLERGVVLLFDYGLPRTHYYHPQREDGTLVCHFKQLAHSDPFVNVGVQDITAWVDFTRVAEGAVAAQLDVLGFVTQAAFLLATGIEELVSETTDIIGHTKRAGEARRLLMPGEMGESFKVMALGREYERPVKGFTLQDLRRSL
ncbi:MAG TPA: SAM-dependent methyltransferase [Steroidobacteraceae bacterium]|jgi:SAM-dependent MidA family methyltransferase